MRLILTLQHILSQKTLHMRIDYSPFEGRSVRGAPSHVLSRGKVIVEEGRRITPRHIRQLEKEALRKLRHPSRSEVLRSFLDD